MSNYSSLKATINANVKTNGNQEITGQVMNAVLNAMVNSLGSGYQYMGIATPTNPGTNQTPDDRRFYIATTPGTYSHLGGLVVNDGEVAILKYDSAWSKEVTGAATAAQVTQLGQEVDNIPGPNYTSGKYLKANGVEEASDTWGITDFVVYTQGNDVEWNFGTPESGSCVLQFYDSNKTPITNAYWGALLPPGTSGGTRTITAAQITSYGPNAAYLRASFYLNNTGAYVKVGEVTAWSPQTSEPGLKQRLQSVETAVQENTENIDKIRERITFSEAGNIVWEITGKYISRDGSVVSYTTYGISSQIEMTTGDELKFTMKSNDTAYLCSVSGGVYTPIMKGYLQGSKTYIAEGDITVVLCGDMTVDATYGIKRASDPIVTKGYLDTAVKSFVLLNPYAGVGYDNPVCSQTHEHCYDKAKLESAYNRGIRVIACSHYLPSTPRFPLSSFNVPYQDYKSKQALLNGDTELVTRYTTGAIPTLNANVGDIDTDQIPQIANAEHPYVRGDAFGQHMNILGLLWGEPGHSLCNGELRENTTENNQLKRDYSIASLDKFNELLENEANWQFGSRYAFGTINHCQSASKAGVILDSCPAIFKGMELFNQGYSEGWNQLFRDAYDAVLKTGKRIWGTAVVDWQGDWATWNFVTAEEQAEWQEKYDELSATEQAEYGSAENYYMQTGRYKFDRGTNVLLMDASYSGLSASDKAKEAVKAYLGGRYYMSGKNTKSMKLVTNGHLVTFKLNDFADKAYVITANGRTEYTGVDTINYVAQASDKFVRFESFWDDGEFVFSNPVWVELES